MLVALLTALVLVNVAYLVLLDRKDSRHARSVTALAEMASREQAAHREEIQTLLQRIQAPERAVVQHETAEIDMTPAPPNDPLTDEAFAEQREMLERLEAEARDFEARLG